MEKSEQETKQEAPSAAEPPAVLVARLAQVEGAAPQGAPVVLLVLVAKGALPVLRLAKVERAARSVFALQARRSTGCRGSKTCPGIVQRSASAIPCIAAVPQHCACCLMVRTAVI